MSPVIIIQRDYNTTGENFHQKKVLEIFLLIIIEILQEISTKFLLIFTSKYVNYSYKFMKFISVIINEMALQNSY